MTEVTANLDAAFEMANKWREATGQNILSAWLPAVKQHANECLLARAFNSHCHVDYQTCGASTLYEQVGPIKIRYSTEVRMISGSGQISFYEDYARAQEFAEVTGWEFVDACDGEDAYVRLPDEIALIAFQFDQGDFADLAVERDAA